MAADSVDFLLAHKIGRCHLLQGGRDGQYAMDLGHPFRLIFEPYNENLCVVKIIEIVDYH
jgi:proteic killer suppression protein